MDGLRLSPPLCPFFSVAPQAYQTDVVDRLILGPSTPGCEHTRVPCAPGTPEFTRGFYCLSPFPYLREPGGSSLSCELMGTSLSFFPPTLPCSRQRGVCINSFSFMVRKEKEEGRGEAGGREGWTQHLGLFFLYLSVRDRHYCFFWVFF